ncbi:glycosyltransferase family 9 protein [Fusobacterium nucleatum]|uniref:glycosyltransferase family 9 protein n=1 Tax=Fusobacterium nucleatum TaxID=851 RepID=UPI0030D50959
MQKNILIIKIGALGDVVRTTYLLPGLKKKYGDNTKIYWVSSKAAFSLLKYNQFIDVIIDVEQDSEIEKIKKIKFDLVLSLEDERNTLIKFKKIKYDKISGTVLNSNNITYTDDLKEWYDMSLISKFGKEKADMLKKENLKSHSEIFSKGLGITEVEPYYFNSIEVENKVDNYMSLFKENFYILGLNLSAGKRWPSKALSMIEGIKLIKKILSYKKRKIFIFLLGGKDDFEYNKKIFDKFKNEVNIILIKPTSLEEFGAIIKNLDMLIVSDTLALHIAISQKIKTISYYAPTSAVEIETFGKGKKIISTSEDYCSYKPDVDNTTITAQKIYNVLEVDLLKD